MSAIAPTVAVTVEEQNSAVSIIAEGVNSASGEARTGAEAMSRVAGATVGRPRHRRRREGAGRTRSPRKPKAWKPRFAAS